MWLGCFDIHATLGLFGTYEEDGFDDVTDGGSFKEVEKLHRSDG